MMLWKAFTGRISIILASSSILFHSPSFAEDPFSPIVLDECPIDSQIRVSHREAVARYTALEACSAQITTTPPTEVSTEEGVVRIIGIGAESLKKRQRNQSQRTERSTTRAPDMATLAYDPEVRLAASRHNIDPLFLHAIIGTESSYRPDATSPAGAVGLMQIMPATGAGLGIARAALADPVRNIDAGARHLKNLQRRFGRNFELILSAYNAGEGAVARYGNRIPPYRETQAYVAKVQRRYQQLRTGFEHAQ
jgi:membrane-bound lytic murein transglycosylase B